MLRIKWICITPNDFNHYCEELKQRFVSQGYQPQPINKHKSRQEKTFKRKDITTLKETKIALVLTYGRSLPSISKVACKHWNILCINKAFKEVFQNEQVTAFRRNRNLKELIGSNKIKLNKLKKHNNIMKKANAPRVQQIHVFFISNQLAKAQGFKLGQKLSNYLSNPKGLN